MEEAFPALPAAPKPVTSVFGYGSGSARRDYGASRNTGFSWGANEAGRGAGGANPPDRELDDGSAGESGAGGGRGKKKGNKGKKQILVQWG